MFLDSSGKNYTINPNVIFCDKTEYILNSCYNSFALLNDLLFMSKENCLYYSIINSPSNPTKLTSFGSKITHLISNKNFIFVVTETEIFVIDGELNKKFKYSVDNIDIVSCSDKYLVFSVKNKLFYVEICKSDIIQINSASFEHAVMKILIQDDTIFVLTSKGTLIHIINLIDDTSRYIRLGWTERYITASTVKDNKLIICSTNTVHIIYLNNERHDCVSVTSFVKDCLINDGKIIVLQDKPETLNYKFTN